jgi:hypothetical protein
MPTIESVELCPALVPLAEQAPKERLCEWFRVWQVPALVFAEEPVVLLAEVDRPDWLSQWAWLSERERLSGQP